MSQTRARREIERFLSTTTPEVLSISGRWGVGKTHAWDELIKTAGSKTLPRYAYVSVFGLRSLDALKTAIFQSTLKLHGGELEPTIASFIENVTSIDGLKNLGELGARKSLGLFSRIGSAVPYAGKAADLLAPGAALLIKNQIICIDDIERAGQGLAVTDILGLVSMLRERKGCKIVLLLNEEGLGDQTEKYREYLEKAVDQAITFEPTPIESAAAAFEAHDKFAPELTQRSTALGITNIRVLRRIRRFLGHLESALTGVHADIVDRVVLSIALLGWCVFEAKRAPSLTRIEQYSEYFGLFAAKERSDEETRADDVLKSYGFSSFDPIDGVILSGLRAGAFDLEAFTKAVGDLTAKMEKVEVRAGIAKPWKILGESFDEDMDAFVAALVASVDNFAADMSPAEASDVIGTLRELGHLAEAQRLLGIYVAAQDRRPREFFAAGDEGSRRPIDPEIRAAFDAKLATMPLLRDPGRVLAEIGSKSGWDPSDVDYLATVPVDEYVAALKRLRGEDLRLAISMGRRFGQFSNSSDNDRAVTDRVNQALARIGAEGPLNHVRVAPYLPDTANEVAPD